MKFRKSRRTEGVAEVNANPSPKCNSGGSAYDDLDRGNAPTVFNLDSEIYQNKSFRTAIWTGVGLQICVMNIPRGGELGIHKNDTSDVFIKLEMGCAGILYGMEKEKLTSVAVNHRHAAVIPGGVYYNIKNTGSSTLRLYVIYAPPCHPYGTVDFTKESADAREGAGS